jgi:hypothetical protein
VYDGDDDDDDDDDDDVADDGDDGGGSTRVFDSLHFIQFQCISLNFIEFH